MYKNYKVNVFIFAGRQNTMELLIPQLSSPIIDTITLAKNTFNQSDLKYIDYLASKDSRIKLIEIPNAIKQDRHHAWKYLYRFMQDNDTIYFKIDDDVIFIKPGYFEKTAAFKLNHPEYLCVFPMTINNPYCNLLPKNSPLSKLPTDTYNKMKLSFYNGEVGRLIHQAFLASPASLEWKVPNTIVTQHDVHWQFEDHPHMVTNMVNWYYAERIAINAICYNGYDFNRLNVANRIQECYSDELFLTYNVFDYTNQVHCVYGDTLVAHFAFSGQKGLRDDTSILNAYKKLIDYTYNRH